MKVSDLIINFLKLKGITHTFCVSGGGCIHLIDSLRTSKLNVTCTHHEQAAIMAAEGYTRQSGKLCASVVTTGPGGTNTMTGLLGMWLDSIPSIIISGQVPSSQLSEGTGCRQIGDQEFDIIESVKPMTKYAKMVKDPSQVLSELEKAYKLATEGRPGPVWLDIPLDVQGAKVEDNIHYVIEKLYKAKKPVIVVGSGIRLSKSYKQINELVELLGIPVVTGPHSGVDCIDNTSKYYCGRIGILGQLTSNKIIQECDLILALGTRMPFKMTGYNVKEFSPNSKKIYVDIDQNELDKHNYKIDKKICMDLNLFLHKLIKSSNFKLNINDWRNKTQKYRSKQIYYHQKHKDIKEYASFYYLIDKAPKYFKNYPIVTSDGTAHVVTQQMYKLNKDQRLFTNVGCASMGYGLPAAIGASIANNKGKVICIEGDGSIMMNLQELQTVVGEKIPLKIIVINNEGYLSIKLTQESFFKGQEFASGPKTGVTLPSMEKLSYAFGLNYFSIKNNKEIDSVLEESIVSEGPCIIEVFTHPMERHEPKVTHKGIDPKTGKIIPGTLTDMTIKDTY